MKSTFQIVVSLVNSAIHSKPIASDIQILNFGAVLNCARRQTVDGLLADIPLHTLLLPTDRALFAQWAASIVALEKLHNTHNIEIARIANTFAMANVRYALLKGQCSASHYAVPTHRKIGDIDIYVSPNSFAKACELMRNLGYTMIEDFPIHTIYKNGEFEVELHKVLQNTYWCLSKHRLLRFMTDHFDNPNITIPQIQILNTQVNILPPEVEILSHTLHIRKHFMSSGIGLRHIYDWALCWNCYKCDVDWTLLHAILGGTHAMRTFRVLYYFAIKYLDFQWSELALDGMPLSSWEKKLAQKLWQMVEETGNFGKDLEHKNISIIHNVYDLYLKRRLQSFVLSPTEVTSELLHKFFQIIMGRVGAKRFMRYYSVDGRAAAASGNIEK